MDRTARLLKIYAIQRGLFSRIAKRLKVDPSYVSRVANGQRKSERIRHAIEAELAKASVLSRKIA